MRLIDAEHLKWNVGGIKCGTLTVAYLDWILEHEEPTVDAELVRHGKWLSREEGCLYPFWERYTCSECGKHADDTKYCPNCGAKMDAGREEE